MKKISDLSINDNVYVVYADAIKKFSINSINRNEISLTIGYYTKLQMSNESHSTIFFQEDSNDRGRTLSVFVSEKDAIEHLKSGCISKIESMKNEIEKKIQLLKDYRLKHFDVLNGFDLSDICFEAKQTL